MALLSNCSKAISSFSAAFAALFLFGAALHAQDYGQQDPARPQYLDLRYDEDWSHIRDSKTHDFLDGIKYLPWGPEGFYTTLGGEVRLRYDNWKDANFGYAPAEYLNSNLQRYMFHADTHLGEHVRVFTQFQSALEFGKKGGPWYLDKDDFELHQAFVDFRTSKDPKNHVTLRVGRQEIALGADHFVSTADFFNSRRVFDGVVLSMGKGNWTWLVQATKPVVIREGAFDDVPENGRTSWGGGFFGPNPITKQGQTSGFYVGLDTKQQLWNRGLGRDQRHTLGARITGGRGQAKALDYTYEALLQVGTFTPVQGPSVAIRAWAVTSETGLTIRNSKYYPRFGIRANVTSGDSGTGSLGTFHPLFPDTAYSSRLAMVGPSNIIDVTPGASMAIRRNWFALFEWSNFWRQNTHDGIYSPSLPTFPPISSGVVSFIAKPGNYSSARYVGNQLGIATQYNVDQHMTYTIAYNYFNAGEFIKQTPPGKNTGFLVTWLTYKF